MTNSRKVEGIVLKKIAYGEKDWVVTLLTKEGSKVTLFAPNARNSIKRFGGSLDLFNFLELVCHEGNDGKLGRIESAEIVILMDGVRKSLIKFAAACYFSELIFEFLQLDEKSPTIFDSFFQFLKGLNGPEDLPSHYIPLMEYHFLELFGFNPTLHACLNCKMTLNPKESYFFNGVKGGLVCLSCTTKEIDNQEVRSFSSQLLIESKNAYPLSFSAVQQMIKGQATHPESWDRLDWNSQDVSQARNALEYFIQYTAGKPLKSLKFLSQMLSS